MHLDENGGIYGVSSFVNSVKSIMCVLRGAAMCTPAAPPPKRPGHRGAGARRATADHRARAAANIESRAATRDAGRHNECCGDENDNRPGCSAQIQWWHKSETTNDELLGFLGL